LDGFHGARLRLAFAVPKDKTVGPFTRMLRQTLVQTGDGIGRQLHASILAPFPLLDLQGLLFPVDLLQLEVRRLRDAQPTAEHHQKQGPVHGLVDLGKEPLDLLSGERFGQGTPAPDNVTGLDGIALDELLVQAKVKKMLERMEPPVDRRPGAAVLMLVLHKLVDLTKGHLSQGDGDWRKEQAQIEGITRNGVHGELPTFEVRLKSVDRGLADVVHGLAPL